MEPELGNYAVYAAFAGGETALPELLSNDLGGSFGIEEAMADDLADEFLCAPVIGFGSALGAEESVAAFFQKEGTELKVTLTAIAELGGDAVDALRTAFAVNEHGELTGDFVVFGNREGAEFALDPFLEKFERNHGDAPRRSECQNMSN